MIAGILPPTPEQPESIRQFSYGGSINYDEILQNLLKLSNKENEYDNMLKSRRKAADRKFEEITSTEKFRQNCVDKQKGCAIAFLAGNQVVSLFLI